LGWIPKHSVPDSIQDYWDYLTAFQEKADILAYAENHMRQLNVIRKCDN
jgi:hypothetical protein